MKRYELEGENQTDEVLEDGEGEGEDPGMVLDEMAVGEWVTEGGTKGKRTVKKGKQQQQQQQPAWDVQEDIKDILDMIPDEYKTPQKRKE